ncbi:MAG: hypothetical protein K0Q55_857 [Verrucomicrobia bacterium]|jgi:uncharacterized membrane protein|nr:hypothetical protein [Verrucomicrobiota bacterium]
METLHSRVGAYPGVSKTNAPWPMSASWRVGFALIAATFLCGVLWSGRVLATKQFYFGYLIWNLFLAWLPLVFAITTRLLFEHCGGCRRTLLSGVAWLLFLPNASYIVTDLIHLRHHTPVPMWFDAALFAAFAFTGVALGFVSLRLIHDVVTERKGWWHGWLFVLGVLALCGFGIYLGRVERWNSWSVLTEPQVLLADLQTMFGSFKSLRYTLRFTGVFFVFLTLCYVLFSGLSSWPVPATSHTDNHR